MGLETVLNELQTRGSEDEQKILRQAEAERQKIVDAAEGEADELRAKKLQETRHRIDALRREQTSAAEFEVRRRILTTQSELTQDFRKRLLEALHKLPKAEREKILGLLVKRVQKELPKGRFHSLAEDQAYIAKASGYAAGKEIQAAGGFQVESEDGDVLYDLRFETLLDAAWKDILAQTQTLFEG